MKKYILPIIGLALLILYIMNVNPSNTVDYENLQNDPELSQATFAGGCFWCTEAAFQELEGVEEAVSGYAGGEEENPTYEEVVAHKTGHREALKVYYYADKISYEELLEVFWKTIDPLDAGGQYADRGFNYTTAIFYQNDNEQALAEASLQALEESGKYDQPIATVIEPYTTFYAAEAFHQDFYKHSAERYQQYKNGSGRK
jgi:peptide methionine sulfoxide reductase msrA/msrB